MKDINKVDMVVRMWVTLTRLKVVKRHSTDFAEFLVWMREARRFEDEFGCEIESA